MYRVLVVCAILALVESYGKPSLEPMLESIERDIIEQDERFQSFCNEKSPAIIGETFGFDKYYLTINLPEAKNSLITVRIKHKFLLTTVTKAGEIIFQDVKILPDMVKTEAATWKYENEENLIITIPYKWPMGEHTGKTCGVVNKFIINVPSTGSYNSQNEYSRPTGSQYGSQGFAGYGNNPSGMPSTGSQYGAQGFAGYGNSPSGMPSTGSQYGSQGFAGYGNSPSGMPPTGAQYGSQGFAGYGNSPSGMPSTQSQGFEYSDAARRTTGFQHGSQSPGGSEYKGTATNFKYRSQDSGGNGFWG